LRVHDSRTLLSGGVDLALGVLSPYFSRPSANGRWEDLLETLAGCDFLNALEVLLKVRTRKWASEVMKLTLTVFTCNSRVASSSTTIIGCGWSWRLDKVHM